MATVGGNDGSPNQLVVHTWTGLDDEQAIYARHTPIAAERISVRGHEAYLYVSTQRGDRGPLQIDVWWVEQPGMAVYVSATNLYEPDELIAILDRLEPVDAERYQSFK